MDNKLDCAVVRDLLPSYADGLTSNETNAAVEEHLKCCENCSSALRRMKEPEKADITPESNVDFLKKVRSRSTRRSLIISIILMLVGMSMVLFRIFYIGSSNDAYGAIQSVEASGNTVEIRGTLSSSGNAVARVTFSDSNGMVQAHVYTAPKAFFNSGDFTASYTAASPVCQVRMGNFIVWENGVRISPIASELFSAVNPYIGDMPANADVAAILGVGEQLGPFTNELQTTAEPYGWTLILEDAISSSDEAVARDIMTADSYAILAVIDNLGTVTWRYNSADGEKKLDVTEADATAFFGRDIKLCSTSASELQALIQKLNIKWSGTRDVFQDEIFKLAIRDMSSDDVYGMSMDYKLGGEVIGKQGTVNANGTPLSNGDIVTFEFTPDNFPEDATALVLAGFSFDLSVINADGSETLICENVEVPAKYAWTVHYMLSGSSGNYTLSEW